MTQKKKSSAAAPLIAMLLLVGTTSSTADTGWKTAPASVPEEDIAGWWEVTPSAVSTRGWCLWGASPVIDDQGRINLMVERWPSGGSWDEGWRKHSEIALYRSEGVKLDGPFYYVKTVLKGTGEGWDAVGMHNSCVHKVDGKYVLLHIANDWLGGLAKHGPNQRIGMRIADSLEGPWRKVGNDGMVLEPGAWCAGSACGVNNPAYVKSPDGKHLIYFKAYPGPRREGIRMGVAVSDKLEGPYRIHDTPITANDHYIEDGTAFLWGDQVCLITTDNHGAIERGGGLLWVSDDGINFREKPLHAFHPLRKYLKHGVPDGARAIYGREIKFERPQMLTVDNRPLCLYLASGTSLDGDDATEVHLLRLK